jgi:acyl-coenzyme A synthetase/AMP-(fatty) acid ligase
MSQPLINIASPLAALAAAQPQTAALIEPWGSVVSRQYTYRELDGESNRLAKGLQAIGLKQGMRTVLMVPPSLEFYALTFALFKLGAVVILIDPGMGVRNLGACLAEAEPEAFIGISKAHLARRLLGWNRRTIRLCVTLGRRLLWAGWTLDQVRKQGDGAGAMVAATRSDEMAAILFTSGSTGVAKGVVYTHGIFAAQVELLRRTYDIQPGEVDLPTFPLFGLFGPALGMTAVIPPMDATRPAQVDPKMILETIKHFQVTNLFGSPALLRRVSSQDSPEACLPSLRRVISAGAPVPAVAIASFCRLLSKTTQVHTPFGATEALPVSTIGSDEILGNTAALTAQGKGTCVGRPVEGMTVKIIRISDDVIPQWNDDLKLANEEIGEIVVQGPVVTRSYYNRPDLTAWAKIEDPSRGSFWHRMGDVGYLDAGGRVWFCGRKSQRVRTQSNTLFTIPCEGVFNSHPNVFRSALVGVNRNAIVEPVLCVEKENGTVKPEEQLRQELLQLGGRHAHTAAIRHILFHPSFPVDIRHNAKIFREKLAVWAARRLP